MRHPRGFTLTELLVLLVLLGIGVALGAPALARIRSESRTAAAAREIAVSFRALRWRSVATGRSHGWLFEKKDGAWTWKVVRDGNGNGLRTAEVGAGTDPVVSGPWRLSDRVAGVDPGFPRDLPVRRIPPRSGWLDRLDDPVKFGASNLIAFGPTGSSSSGTLYVSDGSSLAAVVLFGPTTRVRVWSYDSAPMTWRR